ncbi:MULTISPECIES: amidohydrolase family protein [unclassified Caballeronia]|uniref:amidohydrolase family protein n=1 Tax=unclassified Caballeronia TaxID=2646786 RepID=UPI002863210E|nr:MULTISPECIES: amidohydrolase family protein [unclassified Caballeronia]MDR5816879.1 amidohydrolase family protein [Caballeronia sp. LZ033]MDR5881685.1 amidohydrolase family protein [Caballeronia sp. LZ032]
MKGKIVLEEHLSTALNNSLWDSAGEAARNGKACMSDVNMRLMDVERRLEEMDRNDIDIAVLSLTSPGAQSIVDLNQAVDFARRTNDEIAERFTSRQPRRLRAFATVALQSPKAAADELERAVKQLGMVGALINGYTNLGSAHSAEYLDEPPLWEFWARVAELGIPVYLHPREPLPSQQRIYQGYPALVGSAWGFAHETATHAIRLMLSGLFDRYPKLKIILGHLGEGLPLMLPRLEHRLQMQHEGAGRGAARKTVGKYMRRNFYLTTSGHFHTGALHAALETAGADRVMFSVDYPYESMATGSEWFDKTDMNEEVREKIGRHNAMRLLNL